MNEFDPDELTAEYVRQKKAGYEPAIALERAKGAIASRRESGKGDSFVRGAAQGGSLGFGDEIAGLMGAAAEGIGILDRKLAPGEKSPGFWDRYSEYRDEARTADKEAEAKHLGYYIAGSVAGGLPTAAIPLGAAATVGQAARAGGILGAAAGLGASEADTSQGDVGGVLLDTVAGAATGAGIGAVAHKMVPVVARRVKSIWRRVRGTPTLEEQITARVAQESAATGTAARMADDAAPEPPPSKEVVQQAANLARKTAGERGRTSSLGVDKTVEQASREGRALQGEWSQMADEPFVMFPDQIAGDRAGALARSRAAQFDPTMNAMQGLERKQLQQTTRVLDAYVDKFAADPSAINNPETTRRAGEAARSAFKAMHAARSAEAGPLYDAAEAAGGGVNAGGIMEAVRAEMSPFKSKGLRGQLGGLLSEIEKRGAGGGMSIKEANELRKLAGDVIRGEDHMLDGVDMDIQGAIASRIRDAVDTAFDETAGTASAKGVDLLRQANAVWRKHSQEIESKLTGTVETILRRSRTDKTETISQMIAKAKPEQVRGVFDVLNKSAPDEARNLLAQVIEDRLVMAGKPSRLAPLAREEGASLLSPLGAKNALVELEPVLHAAARGDNRLRFEYAKMYKLLTRVGHGPGLRGSQTAPMASPVLEGIAEKAGEVSAIAKQTVKAANQIRASLDRSEQMLAEALSTRSGVRAINIALEIKLAEKAGHGISPAMAARLVDAASKAGISPAVSAVPQLGGRVQPPGGIAAGQQGADRHAQAQGDQ